MTPPPLVLVALGSNTGAPSCNVHDALDILGTRRPAGFQASTLHRSTPVDCPPGSPDFINAAACFLALPTDTPESLLAWFQDLERQFGRRPKTVLNEPRPLDLDLIAFGSERRSSPTLTLPHPRAHLRHFVLAPLAEIAPTFTPPDWPGPIATVLRQLPHPNPRS